MKRCISGAVVGLVIAACGGPEPAVPTIRRVDLDSWRGVPVIELEKHPGFAALPHLVRPLSDGSSMWILTKCYGGQNPERCYTSLRANYFGRSANAFTTCTGGDRYSFCCHNEFVVKDGIVQSYNVVGPCSTSCRNRPATAICAD